MLRDSQNHLQLVCCSSRPSYSFDWFDWNTQVLLCFTFSQFCVFFGQIIFLGEVYSNIAMYIILKLNSWEWLLYMLIFLLHCPMCTLDIEALFLRFFFSNNPYFYISYLVANPFFNAPLYYAVNIYHQFSFRINQTPLTERLYLNNI